MSENVLLVTFEPINVHYAASRKALSTFLLAKEEGKESGTKQCRQWKDAIRYLTKIAN